MIWKGESQKLQVLFCNHCRRHAKRPACASDAFGGEHKRRNSCEVLFNALAFDVGGPLDAYHAYSSDVFLSPQLFCSFLCKQLTINRQSTRMNFLFYCICNHLQNLLQWWAQNEDRFPRFDKLCDCYLAVPASRTPSERIFFFSDTFMLMCCNVYVPPNFGVHLEWI